jgi:hypothetical protein
LATNHLIQLHLLLSTLFLYSLLSLLNFQRTNQLRIKRKLILQS